MDDEHTPALGFQEFLKSKVTPGNMTDFYLGDGLLCVDNLRKVLAAYPVGAYVPLEVLRESVLHSPRKVQAALDWSAGHSVRTGIVAHPDRKAYRLRGLTH